MHFGNFAFSHKSFEKSISDGLFIVEKQKEARTMMGIDELMDLTMYSSMYLLFYMAYFYVEGANLLVPCRVNANFKRILSRFTSFFRGFIGAGGWRASAAL